MMFFTVLGIMVVVFVVAVVVFAVTDFGPINRSGFIFTVCRFGFVYAKPGTSFNENLNRTRKTKGKRLFLCTPTWASRYIKQIRDGEY
ncbi:MAG: hypothetical protein LC650_03485 [Actinobacteria bacterium]|nr:hypothetical protein [Actinomycetota bacterium]